MTNPLPLRPTDELVGVAWVATVPGLSPDMVATQLPPDADKDNTPAEWVARGKGFVTVSVVGGNPDPLLPVHRPVLQLDCWAVEPGSNKPPWAIANRLAEAITFATWGRFSIARPLDITVKGVQYPLAVVQGARVATAPRRLWDDAGDYARYSMDLWLSWIAPGDRIDT